MSIIYSFVHLVLQYLFNTQQHGPNAVFFLLGTQASECSLILFLPEPEGYPSSNGQRPYRGLILATTCLVADRSPCHLARRVPVMQRLLQPPFPVWTLGLACASARDHYSGTAHVALASAGLQASEGVHFVVLESGKTSSVVSKRSTAWRAAGIDRNSTDNPDYLEYG